MMRPLTLAALLLATTLIGCGEPPVPSMHDCEYPVTLCQDVLPPGFSLCVMGPKAKEDTP